MKPWIPAFAGIHHGHELAQQAANLWCTMVGVLA